MSFEPTDERCLTCDYYRQGDGKEYISRCLVDEMGLSYPPDDCPILEDKVIEWLSGWFGQGILRSGFPSLLNS